MITGLHDSIRGLVLERGNISPLEVDVRFEPPTTERIARLTRPTVSFFLFEINENTDLRRNDFQSTSTNGHSERRLPPRRVDLHYMVSVLTSEVDDEHLLLWRVLATLMKYHEIPADILPEEVLKTGTPVVTRTAQPDDMNRAGELWSGLGIEPHPAIVYIVTAPLDLDVVIEAPLVLTRTTRYSRRNVVAEPDEIRHIGGVVRGPEGEPLVGATVLIDGRARDGCVTDSVGRYVLTRVPAGSVELTVSTSEGDVRTATIDVPGDSYDVALGDDE